MNSLRKFVSGAAVALAIGLGAGAANASPINLTIPVDTAVNPAIQQVHHRHHGHGGYLCYMPFRRLVHIFGYHRALRIKFRCNYYW
jgi:hypothetical protein